MPATGTSVIPLPIGPAPRLRTAKWKLTHYLGDSQVVGKLPLANYGAKQVPNSLSNQTTQQPAWQSTKRQATQPPNLLSIQPTNLRSFQPTYQQPMVVYHEQ